MNSSWGNGTRWSINSGFALLQAEASAAVSINAPRQNVLLGDSITLWFPSDMLPGRKTWLNQAISGENSGGLLNRLYVLDSNEVEAFFIMVGINDMIWGGKDEDLTYNVRSMINYLQEQHPDARIVVQSILPHGGENASWEGRDKLAAISPSRVEAVNEKLELIAAELGVDYLDLHPLFANGEGFIRPDLTTDGLHLNEDGYMVWRTAIALYNQANFEPLRNGDSITWDGCLGCPRAGRMPALQKLDVIKSSFLRKELQPSGMAVLAVPRRHPACPTSIGCYTPPTAKKFLSKGDHPQRRSFFFREPSPATLLRGIHF